MRNPQGQSIFWQSRSPRHPPRPQHPLAPITGSNAGSKAASLPAPSCDKAHETSSRGNQLKFSHQWEIHLCFTPTQHACSPRGCTAQVNPAAPCRKAGGEEGWSSMPAHRGTGTAPERSRDAPGAANSPAVTWDHTAAPGGQTCWSPSMHAAASLCFRGNIRQQQVMLKLKPPYHR